MVAKRAKNSRTSGTDIPAAKTVRKTARKTPARKTSARKTSPGKTPAGKARAATAARQSKHAPVGLVEIVQNALQDMKAINIAVLDVRELTDIADTLVVASGTSDRHVRSIAERVVEFAKKAGFRPLGVEGERDGEWVLVDLQDIVVHIMLPRVREFYRLENLWDVSAGRRQAAGG